ncbi:peptidoglycan DD-metalloendopeptidase family protein [Streptomyces sp. NPDC001380]|uniref:peptidoglycan DD-metalloendopeptidase family protein n=1 Tax=Streptomyces sp. NPDC001380 TaxID=3364566 RepID=UPI003684FEEB
MAYEGHGAGAVFPPPAAPEPSYDGAPHDASGTWYGHGAADPSASWAVGGGWHQDTGAGVHHHGTGGWGTGGAAADTAWTTAAFSSADTTGQFEAQGTWTTGYGEGAYGDGGYGESGYAGTGYGYGAQHAGYGESGYVGTPYAHVPAQTRHDEAQPYEGAYGTGDGDTGSEAYADAYTAAGHGQDGGTGSGADRHEGQDGGPDGHPYDDGGTYAAYDGTGESGAYDAHGSYGYGVHDDAGTYGDEPDGAADTHATGTPGADAYEQDAYEEDGYKEDGHGADGPDGHDAALAVAGPAGGRAAARAAARGARGRTRTARRSALLTIAVPSVAVMGVAAAAAVTVSVPDQGHAHDTAADATDEAPAAASPKVAAASSMLDSQLAGLRRNADDFAGRVSRDQARIDLRTRQAAERARKEAMRPKYVMPVAVHGLSATFGMAGEHWAALHTGIDFPVSWGTSVRAATDGTVRTQWNPAYGYMAIVTSPSGTETWYCHLSSYRIRSGSVKAGDTIAYSGSSGNSTGPHLHFEVHTGGEGSPAVDPLPWMLSHGIDPR